MKPILQFILALLLATVLLAVFIVSAPYLAMQTAWGIVTGENNDY